MLIPALIIVSPSEIVPIIDIGTIIIKRKVSAGGKERWFTVARVDFFLPAAFIIF
jgi:predicted DNA-binding ArsR family transcriptional regulator